MAKDLDIRRRIKSVKSTRSITKAMQMVSASKMRKAQEQALKTRNYALKSLEILATISGKITDYPHYLLARPEKKRCLMLLITSNKGLCGSLNANVMRKAFDFVEFMKSNKGVEAEEVDFVTLGKKGRDMLFRAGKKVIADFSDLGESLSVLNIGAITKLIFGEFQTQNYSRIYIAYSHFVSVLSQKPVVKRLLPLDKGILEYLEEVLNKKKEDLQRDSYEYLVEPNPKELLEDLLPRLVEIQIFQSYLEGYASEQSARMVAMKNATEAAGDLIEDLTLTYNKARQAGITQEISEIVGGVEALKK
ncbi:ATP synthase F1 subunit gamma [Candidatus Peregrinibacteria bacterium]|nr:ATP synthase F1 subunit gamma [Candidatus Peregrinibacteria bacterium]